MRLAVVAAGLVVAGFAGCLDPATPDLATGDLLVPLDWAELALPFGDEHDHENRSQHRGLSTPNFEVVGYDPLLSPYYGGKASGANFCGDAQPTTDGRVLAVVESRSDVAFTLVDVTDPAAPQWLGEFVMPTTHVYDLAMVPDGKHVVLVTSDLRDAEMGLPREPPVDPPVQGGIRWRSACSPALEPLRDAAGEPDLAPRPMSILLVSVEDPNNPVIVDHQPLLGSGHSVFAMNHDGAMLFMVTTTRYYTPLVVGPFPPSQVASAPDKGEVTVYEFYELAAGPTNARLNLLSVWKPPADETSAQTLGPRGHDGWMAVHPGTGTLYAYAIGHDRLTILDMTDPSSPEEVGRWSEAGPGREGFTGQLHSVIPLTELWDGRHYTIIGPEWGGQPADHPSGIVWVLDTTDPAKPLAVAAWTLPEVASWAGTYMFSNHYYGVHGKTMFISMYHGGIWAVDLSPVGRSAWELLPSVGVYLPDIDPPGEVAYARRWAPTVEEALVLPDGTIVTFDGNSGLYALRFDATKPAPAPEPWPIAQVP